MKQSAVDTLGHTDLASLVYRKVKQLILSNHFPPGEKLPLDEIARDLGVSRTPLLKALQILEHEMLVESIPRRGIFVKDLGLKEIVDAFDCREAIESVATRLAVERITDAQIAELRALFLPFLATPDTIDLTQYVEADRRFHKTLIQISGNEILARLEVVGNIHRITYYRGLTRPPEETLSEHFAIIDALERRDQEAAEELMRMHTRRSRERIAAAMKVEALKSSAHPRNDGGDS